MVTSGEGFPCAVAAGCFPRGYIGFVVVWLVGGCIRSILQRIMPGRKACPKAVQRGPRPQLRSWDLRWRRFVFKTLFVRHAQVMFNTLGSILKHLKGERSELAAEGVAARSTPASEPGGDAGFEILQ